LYAWEILLILVKDKDPERLRKAGSEVVSLLQHHIGSVDKVDILIPLMRRRAPWIPSQNMRSPSSKSPWRPSLSRRMKE
jgi:hypothetical protein